MIASREQALPETTLYVPLFILLHFSSLLDSYFCFVKADLLEKSRALIENTAELQVGAN